MAKKSSVNLLYDNLIPLDRWDKIYLWITDVAKYLLILAQLALLITFVVHLIYDHKLDKMQDQIKAQVALLKNRRNEEKRVTILAKTLEELQNLYEDKQSMAKSYEYLLKLIPEGIKLKSVHITYKSVSLNGEAGSYDALKTFLDNLNNSSAIGKDTIVTSTNQRQGGSILFAINFEFKRNGRY